MSDLIYYIVELNLTISVSDQRKVSVKCTKCLSLGTNRLGTKDPRVRNDWISQLLLTGKILHRAPKHRISAVPTRTGSRQAQLPLRKSG